jgi:hypothetical protein
MLVAPLGALLHSGSYGGDRGERHARPHRDGRHREILVGEAALGQEEACIASSAVSDGASMIATP